MNDQTLTDGPPTTAPKKQLSEFCLALRAWRWRKGLTQAQAAPHFCISHEAYKKWEQGRHAPVGANWALAWKVLQATDKNKKQQHSDTV